MSIFLLALLSILISVAAQFSLKAGMSSANVKSALSNGFNSHTIYSIASNPFIISGFALYAAGAIVWLSVLAKWDVSKAYPMVGLGFAASGIIGFMFGENINLIRLLGILTIITGVCIVGKS